MEKLLIVLSLFLLIGSGSLAQSKRELRIQNRAKEVGEFQFGMRSTISLFDHSTYPGLGYGGMFRIRPTKRTNTEWYADYIKTDIAGLGFRETVHIGWSVMIFPLKTESIKGKVLPYFIGGNCFDYARVTSNKFLLVANNHLHQNSVEHYTTAVQAGLGANFQITDKFNLSLSVQYMQHIGKSLHTHVVNKYNEEVTDKSKYNDDGNYLNVEAEHSQTVLAGHLLTTLSLNLTLFDMAR
jgi:hypothetical protein